MKSIHITEGDFVVTSGLLVAEGTAEVQASGTATVILFDKATCVASGQAHVTARGANNVHISEDAEADVGGTSHLEAYGKARFTLRGKARGLVMGESEGFVLEDAAITALGRARLTMMARGELIVGEEALVNYATNTTWGGAKGRCLQITPAFMKELAAKLRTLQAVKNDGRGVSCVRTIVSELERGDLTGALAVTNNESDKIRSYMDIVQVLREAGFWYEIDFSKF